MQDLARDQRILAAIFSVEGCGKRGGLLPAAGPLCGGGNNQYDRATKSGRGRLTQALANGTMKLSEGSPHSDIDIESRKEMKF